MPATRPHFIAGPQPGGLRIGLQPSQLGPVLGISGITKDSTGAVLANCTVSLFRRRGPGDYVCTDEMASDASGFYRFISVSPNEVYFIVAYKPGGPDVTGATVNTLSGA